MKAKRLLFLVMAICLASGVKAQSDGIYFYITAGGSIDNPESNGSDVWLYAVLIENGKLYRGRYSAVTTNFKVLAKRYEEGNLKSDLHKNYFNWIFEYNSSKSGYDKKVYMYHHSGWRNPLPLQPSIPEHDMYLEFTNNMSKLLEWETWGNDRNTFQRISESDILKFSKNKTFYE